MPDPAELEIVGADANNLKNIDVRLPVGGITVVAGVSGSGKSSFLAETLAAEGARRDRTFVGSSQSVLERDDVRAFIGRTPPTVLFGQRGFRPSSRTTVATATGLLTVLRRLFVLGSRPYSDLVQADVPEPSPQSYAAWLIRHQKGPVEVWASPLRMQKSDGVAVVRRLAEHGIETVRLYSETDPPRLQKEGREVTTKAFKPLNPATAHSIEACLGRFKTLDDGDAAALQSTLDHAFTASGGAVIVTLPQASDPVLEGAFGARLDSKRHWVHPADPAVYLAASNHLLSFNAPGQEDSGACPVCSGTGLRRQVDLKAFIEDPKRTMKEGAFALWTSKNYKHLNIQHETITGLEGVAGFSGTTPWDRLPKAAQQLVLYGSNGSPIQDRDERGRAFGSPRPFRGFVPILLEKAAAGTRTSDALAAFVTLGSCDACKGSRWSPQARALRLGEESLDSILHRTFEELVELFCESATSSMATVRSLGPLIEAMRRRAQEIVLVGLSYMTADRGMLAVSDGESRRLRLARVVNPSEGGLCLLLDEPARGLHEADLGRLAQALDSLRGRHTVVLNEHRQRLWGIADQLIQIGPGAGPEGGRVVYAGPPPPEASTKSDRRQPLATPKADDPWIKIRGAALHNLLDVDCDIPLGRFSAICGVSGSGKSSFVHGVLTPALLGDQGAPKMSSSPRLWREANGLQDAGEVVVLDQRMPPPNRRSLVATFSGVFERVRKSFAATAAAKAEGLSAADFGVNGGAGRCPTCEGIGQVVDGDLFTTCPTCGGARYGRRVLAVRLDGMNIQEFLETPIGKLPSDVAAFGVPLKLLRNMAELGVGHLAFGRPVDTLSGGELQRLRLAQRLAAPKASRSVFLLDEPAVGLHPDDVTVLIQALDRALDGGRNTIIAVEHDLALIGASDWVVEFGPGSGPNGGQVVFQGRVDDLQTRSTETAKALAGKLEPIRRRTRGGKVPGALSEPIRRAHRTSALLRTLMTGDLPSDPDAEDGVLEPAAFVDAHLWSGRDPWEAADLHLEAPKFFLDIERQKRLHAQGALIEAWSRAPQAELTISPFLSEIRIWGARLPASIVKGVTAHAIEEGLRIGDVGSPSKDRQKVDGLRATGDRFRPSGLAPADRAAALQDALALGAGYVELRSPEGNLLAVAGERLVDLSQGLVAPMRAVPAHFSRLDVQGRCPACKGARLSPHLSQSLVILNPDLSPVDDDFLAPSAKAILKTSMRSQLIPLLRRLAKEGLWDLAIPFRALSVADRHLILEGAWSRPGFGSFLKTPNADPAEVASWLRWDGLHREIQGQIDRSPDRSWMAAVKSTARLHACPVCAGTGLQPFARLLPAGDMTYPDWAMSQAPDKLGILETSKPATPRSERTLKRLEACLSLDRGDAPSGPTVAHRAIAAFTTMTPVTPVPGPGPHA